MVWSNDLSGSQIPAKSKRLVRLRQENRCVCVVPIACTGRIDTYDHSANIAALGVERSHANDPALIEGFCGPCHLARTQREVSASRWGRQYRKPQEQPGTETTPGAPLVTIKETT